MKKPLRISRRTLLKATGAAALGIHEGDRVLSPQIGTMK